MKVIYMPPADMVRERRKLMYLEKWPVEAQMEALTEASMGRPEKLENLKKDLAEIRRVLPLFNHESNKGGNK